MFYGWKAYVPVAQRRANAARAAKQLAKKRGRELQPIALDGRKIANTFWGKAWCESLENHSDFENRLPRGRTYVRNGSVIDLDIKQGCIDALVSGSELYTVRIDINRLEPAHWNDLKSECSESIDSLLDLLGGKFSDGVMRRLSHPERGLFPQPKEIKMSCSCPDWAVLCKHVAAVLYGVGARLDREPQLLFVLRGVDHSELVIQAVSDDNLDAALSAPAGPLAGEDLGAMFGIELDSNTAGAKPMKAKRRARSISDTELPAVAKRPAKKKAATAVAVIVEKPAAKKSRSRSTAPAAARTQQVSSAKTKSLVVVEAKSAEKKISTRRPRATR